MLIGLVSDTHIPDRRIKLPQKVLESFEGVDLIIHAGDITSQSVIDELEAIAPVVAVEGNMDRVHGEIDLNPSEIIEAEGHKIGVMHGMGRSIREEIHNNYIIMHCNWKLTSL